MMRRVAVRPTLIMACGALVAAAARATAQSGAVLRGVVYDSLISAAPLAGAEVWIEGTNRMARTDPTGRFELVVPAAGRYTLTFDDPVLDSIGLSASPVVVEVAAGGTARVALGTPGPSAAHRALCPHDPWQGTGAILGLVRDVADGTLLADVAVTAHWTTYTIGAGAVRATPATATARSDASGRILICNLPTDVGLLVQGRAGDGPTGMVLIDLAGRAFGRTDLQLAVAPATGAVRGVVRNQSGITVPGAAVVAVGGEARVAADEAGGFTLGNVAAGSRVLEATAIGYPPARVQVRIPPGGTQQLTIVLGDSAHVLEPVTVEARYQPYLTRVGFEHRRSTAMGHFLDTTEIRRAGAVQFEEVFRMVPGVQLRPNGSSYLVELKRGQGQITNRELANYCPPSYFIDGAYFPLPPVETPSVPVAPEEILAIEIYANLFSAPLQYQRLNSGCGVILVWTKRGVPKGKK